MSRRILTRIRPCGLPPSLGYLPLLLALVCSLVVLALPLLAGKPTEDPLKESLLSSLFTDETAILADFRNEQLLSIDLVPPNVPVLLFNQNVRVFDPKRFQNAFLDALVGVTRDGVTVFPLLVFEDKSTRELVFANALDQEILAVAQPGYNPLWLLYDKHEELRNTVRSDDEFLALAEQYDPSRVAVRYELLLEQDVDAYLASQRPADPDIPIVIMSMDGTPTDIYFTAITRDSSDMELAIAYPTNVTSLDVFSVDGGVGLIGFWWNLRDTISLSGSTNDTTWTDTSASTATIRFYAVANADTNSATDPDDDGLTWGREHYLYHTCPTNADTDGDGINDNVEVLIDNTDPNNDDTTAPSVAIDTPAEGFNWVWLP